MKKSAVQKVEQNTNQVKIKKLFLNIKFLFEVKLTTYYNKLNFF